MRRARKAMTVITLAATTGIIGVVSTSLSSPSELKFRERTVAGTPQDLMIVRHLRLEGSNAQIGAKLAEIARDRHGARGDTAPGTLAADQLAWLQSHWPEMAERSAGGATFFGRKAGENGFDPTSLGYDLNVRPGCSVVFYPMNSVAGGHAMLSRNYDFPTGTYSEITGAP